MESSRSTASCTPPISGASSSSCLDVSVRSRGFVAAIGIAATLLAMPARAITVVTVGKTAVLRQAKGGASALFRVGRDPAFATLVDPTCAGGGSMTLQVASYPVASARVDALAKAPLP